MAKKKKNAVKVPAKRKAPTPVRTEFMSAFTSEFIRDPKTKVWKWPAPGQTPESIVEDFETYIDVLMRADFVLPSNGNSALRTRLAAFLINQHWPVTASIPKKWKKIQPTVHLIEISVIVDRLLMAVNIAKNPTKSGGGPSGWPPH
jgi:hypothetical protein